ncbi:MAG: calcium-binding protein [Hyphomicrobiales bacterium]|nr:calcium-binding protein [Hyphomicrobiales bacterium]
MTSVSTNSLETFAIAAGGGKIGVEVAGELVFHTIKTTAKVKQGATINESAANTTAGDQQDVSVIAARSYNGIAVGAGGALGAAAITVGFGVPLLFGETTAEIRGGSTSTAGDETTVNAKSDIEVVARAQERIIGVGGGISIGKVAGGGSLAFLHMNTSTTATITGEVVATAQGNVAVVAQDDTETYSIGGLIALSGSGVAGGAGIGVQYLLKETSATIADGAVVTAEANSTALTGALDGELSDDGTPGIIADFQGVLVDARSSEKVFTLAAAISGTSSGVSIVGSLAVDYIDSDTIAGILSGARVNQSVSGSDFADDQSVNVSALNDFGHFFGAGAISVALGGGAGGVALGWAVIQNDTQAIIGPGTAVFANRDVDVNAVSNRDVIGWGLAGAVSGTLSVGGGFIVYTLGGNFDTTYETDQDADGAGNGASQDLSSIDYSSNGSSNDRNEDLYGTFDTIVEDLFEAFESDEETLPGVAVSEIDDKDAITFTADDGTVGTFGLVTGDVVHYSKAGNAAAIPGLTDGEAYYVIVVDPDDTNTARIQLATTREAALLGFVDDNGDGVNDNGNFIEIHDPAFTSSEDHIFTKGIPAFEPSALEDAAGVPVSFNSDDPAGSSITFDADYGFRTGDAIFYAAGDSTAGQGTAIDGLEDRRAYFVIVDDSDPKTIRLADSRSDALTGTAIAFDVGGAAGDSHRFYRDSSGIAEVANTSATGANPGFDSSDIRGVSTQQGTSAQIAGGAIVEATNVDLDARQKIKMEIIVGGLGVGLKAGGVGVGVGVVTVDADVSAFVDDGATIRGLSPSLGKLSIDATNDTEADFLAVAGGAGLYAGVGGSIAAYTDKSDAYALLGAAPNETSTAATVVTGFADILVGAEVDQELTISALGVGAAIGVGAGLAYVPATFSGDTVAGIGELVEIGSSSDASRAVGNVSVSADTDVFVGTYDGAQDDNPNLDGVGVMALGVGVGIGGFGGGFAIVKDETDTRAYVGEGADIYIDGAFSLTANSVSDLEARADGGALGAIAIGVMISQAKTTGSTKAQINGGASITRLRAGSVAVSATATVTNTAETIAAAGGILAVLINEATAEATTTVLAEIGQNVAMTTVDTGATAGQDIVISASTNMHANADMFGVSVGGIDIAIANSTATVSPTVEAKIGAGAVLDSAGAIVVTSLHEISNDGAKARAQPHGGGIVAVSAGQAISRASAVVRASIGEGAEITADSNLTLQSAATNRANAEAKTIRVGAIAFGNTEAYAIAEGATEAFVASSPANQTKISAKDVLIQSAASNFADTETVASGGGILSGRGAHSGSNVNAANRAFIGDGSIVTASGSVTVGATETPEADAEAKGTGIGVIDVGASKTETYVGYNVAFTTNSDGEVTAVYTKAPATISAYIGTGAEVDAGLDISVSTHIGATAGSEFDDTIDVGDVDTGTGGITINENNNGHGLETGDSIVYDSGGNDGLKTDDATGTRLEHGREYNIVKLGDAELRLGNAFDASEATTNTNGDLVGIDPDTDTIFFARSHNFESGDIVIYSNASNGSVAGLTDGNRYEVLVLDDLSIKLIDVDNRPAAAKAFTPESSLGADNKTLTIAGHGFTEGQAITYRAPGEISITPDLIDVTVVGETVDGETVFVPVTSGDAITHDDAANNIFVGEHSFTTGDTIVYETDGDAIVVDALSPLSLSKGAISQAGPNGAKITVFSKSNHGLMNGERLTVSGSQFDNIPNGSFFALVLDDGRFALVNSQATALNHNYGAALSFDVSADAGSDSLTFSTASTRTLIDGGIYEVVRDGPASIQLRDVTPTTDADYNASPGARAVIAIGSTAVNGSHTIVGTGDQPIDGLTVGTTYHALNVNGDTFQLASSVGGPALTLGADGRDGSHTLGTEGVDLDEAAGTHELYIPIAEQPANDGEHRILGPGGVSLKFAVSAVGDGISYSKATGSSGNLIGVNETTADMNVAYDIDAYIQGTTVTAGRDVSIASTSDISTFAFADTDTEFAVLGAGNTSRADSVVDAINDVWLDGTVTVGQDLKLLAETENELQTDARAEGLGVFGTNSIARSDAKLDYDTTVQLKSGADIAVVGTATLESKSISDANSSTNARAGSIGNAATANDDSRSTESRSNGTTIGGNGDPVVTDVIINAAALAAERISIAAIGHDDAYGYAKAKGEGLGTDPDATSRAEIDSKTLVDVKTGADITGTRGVKIEAKHIKADAEAYSRGVAGAFGANTDVTAIADITLIDQVITAAGATFTVGPGVDGTNTALAVTSSTAGVDRDTTTSRSGAVIETGKKRSRGDTQQSRTISWNADVNLATTGSPELEVDANGRIVTEDHLDVIGFGVGDTVSGDIIVDDIPDPTDVSRIVFTATEQVSGSLDTTFIDTLLAVDIVNNSDLNMVINNIDTFVGTLAPQIIVITNDDQLTRSSTRDADASDIRIENNGPGDLTLAGTITNPLGTTTISNAGGNIVAATERSVVANGRTSLIVTNDLRITADAGNIGSDGTTATPLAVDLVDYELSGVLQDINLVATAGASAHLDLKGRHRVDAAGPLAFTIPDIKAVEDINLTLRVGEQEDPQFTIGATTYSVPLRSTNTDPRNTAYTFANGAGAGLIAGDDIIVALEPSPTDTVTIVALTDVDASNAAIGTTRDDDGEIFVSSNGSITLTEITGDLRTGEIVSSAGDVTLTAVDGSITDPLDDVATDVAGGIVTLTADQGGIGAQTSFLEIDSRTKLIAAARDDIFIEEDDGDLNVDTVTSALQSVVLWASAGSIVDVNNDDAGNVFGNAIDLRAANAIGSDGNFFEIDTGETAGADIFNAKTGGGIFVIEIDGPLQAVNVLSDSGGIRLRLPDTAALDESFTLLGSGAVRYDEEAGSTTEIGQITARGADGIFLLTAGDDITIADNTSITTGSTLIMFGDFNSVDPDAGFGTTIRIGAATLASGVDTDRATHAISVFGNADVDDITFAGTTLQSNAFAYGSVSATTGTGDGEDRFVIDELAATKVTNGGTTTRFSLTLDGQAGTDSYTVFTAGSEALAADRGDYIVNVLDTGARDDGSDTLDIFGKDGDDDIFLLRRSTSLPGFPDADAPGYVALIYGTLDQATASSEDAAVRPQELARINYDSHLNGRLSVFGGGGNDYFATDDTSAIITLDGGEGDDSFQIGQIYGSARDAGANLAAEDRFETLETTQGFLSRGISMPLVARGGGGGDTFTVYSNQAQLRLEGDAGNDEFLVRAFALSGGAGVTTTQLTQLNSGAGDDLIQYNVNAPVSIDGGAGFDKVVVLGTEFGDAFVVTDEGIFGAGLNIELSGNEELQEIDGLEGDDIIFVLSTPSNAGTRVIGGLGSDTINVASDVTETIISRELDGLSGVINHQVTSPVDIDYDGVLAPGIDINVASDDEGLVVINQAADETRVSEEGETFVSYGVKLAKPPEAGQKVYVNISAARSTKTEQDATPAGDTVRIGRSSTGFTRDVTVDGAVETRDNRDIVLVFDSTNWNAEQEVFVQAIDDGLSEGERTVVISHSTASTDPDFDQVDVKNVDIVVQDNDRAELVILEVDETGAQDNESLVLEGDATTRETDNITVALAKPPEPGEVVTVTLAADSDQLGLSQTVLTFNLDGSGGHQKWDVPVTVEIFATEEAGTAGDPAVAEDTKTSKITVSTTSSTGGSYASAEDQTVDVTVHDNDTAGVLVVETDGSTVVTDSDTDSYTMRLTKAPTGEVSINLLTDGQADVVDVLDENGNSLSGTRFTLQNIGTAGDGLLAGAVTITANGIDPESLELDDGSSWRDAGFEEGRLIEIIVGGVTVNAKIASISDGANGEVDSVITLTEVEGLAAGAAQNATVTRQAAAISFDANNYFQDVTIVVAKDGDFSKPADRRFVKEFPIAAHTLSSIQGPLEVIGGQETPRSLVAAVILPGEDNSDPIGNDLGLDGSDAASIDTLNVFDDTSQENKVGTLTSTSLTGLGLSDALSIVDPDTGAVINFDAGITFSDTAGFEIEILNLFLGSGDDTLTVEGSTSSTADHGGITVLHGGGNTFDAATGTRGGDTFIVTGGGGVDAPLVIYGDTSQDGTWYAGNPAEPSSGTFGLGGTAFDYPLANPFDHHGDDVIDASGLFAGGGAPVVGLTIYGGRGQDVITGSGAGDHIAGGSGNDTINGGAGPDHIYGDAGFNVDPVSRSLIVVNENTSAEAVADPLLLSADTIDGGAGNDIVFGDFGEIIQAAAADPSDPGFDYLDTPDNDPQLKLLTTEAATVWQIRTVRVEGAGGRDGADTIRGGEDDDVILGGIGSATAGDTLFGENGTGAGTGDDILIGDFGTVIPKLGVLTDGRVFTTATGLGDGDTIFGERGDDWIFGGADRDDIDGGRDDDIILGDLGGAIGNDGSSNRRTVFSLDPEIGTGDLITGSFGNDQIIGGSGDDDVTGAEGDDLIFGDNARIEQTDDFRPLVAAAIFETRGGNDRLLGESGFDVILGGAGDDFIDGGAQADRLLGDVGEARFSPDFGTLAVERLRFITTTTSSVAGNDTIFGGSGADWAFGAQGDDTIFGEEGDDVVVGDSAQASFFSDGGGLRGSFTTIDPFRGGNDVVSGGPGNDVIIGGGRGGDLLIGDNSEDLLFGDNVAFTFNSLDFSNLNRAVGNFTHFQFDAIIIRNTLGGATGARIFDRGADDEDGFFASGSSGRIFSEGDIPAGSGGLSSSRYFDPDFDLGPARRPGLWDQFLEDLLDGEDDPEPEEDLRPQDFNYGPGPLSAPAPTDTPMVSVPGDDDIITGTTGTTGAPGQKPAGANDGANPKPKPKPKKPGDRGADVSPTPLDGLEDLTGGVLIGAVACTRGRVQGERRATGMWTFDPRGTGLKRAPGKDTLTYDSKAGALKSTSR